MKLMVAYDGTEVANHAIEVAASHAKAFNGDITIVTSMEGGPSVPRKEFETAERNLKRAENMVKDKKIPCETHLLVRGLGPGEDLVRFAEEQGVDELFMGVRRRSKVGKLVFGSTAQYVILNAPCAVVTVK